MFLQFKAYKLGNNKNNTEVNSNILELILKSMIEEKINIFEKLMYFILAFTF